MPISQEELNRHSHRIERENRKILEKLTKHSKKGIDGEMFDLHAEVFETTDCLSCANCCKTISPVFKERDISRLADHFGIRPGEMVSRYLKLDQDGDYVPQSIPCPFLLPDNKCSVYEHRPQACKGYPHTDTLPISKSLNLIVKNSAVCPAVYEMVRQLAIKHGI